MKKMIFALAAILLLASCGGSEEKQSGSDTSIVIDLGVIDSTKLDSLNVVTDSVHLNDAAGGESSAHEIPVK